MQKFSLFKNIKWCNVHETDWIVDIDKDLLLKQTFLKVLCVGVCVFERERERDIWRKTEREGETDGES